MTRIVVAAHSHDFQRKRALRGLTDSGWWSTVAALAATICPEISDALGGMSAACSVLMIAPPDRLAGIAEIEAAADRCGCLAGVTAAPNQAGFAMLLLAPDGGTLVRGIAAVFHVASRAALGVELAPRRKKQPACAFHAVTPGARISKVSECGDRTGQLELSGHGARQYEASDFHAIKRIVAPVIDRPNHRSTNLVRFSDQCLGGHVPPFVLDANAIVAILGFPIRVQHDTTVSIGATGALAARKLLKPWLERRVGKASVRSRANAGSKTSKATAKTAQHLIHVTIYFLSTLRSRKLKRTASA